MSSKIQIFKIIGLLPLNYVVIKCGDAKTANCDIMYNADTVIFIRDNLKMNQFAFSFLLGVSGINANDDIEKIITKYFTFTPPIGLSASELKEYRINYYTQLLNEKIVDKLWNFSPKKSTAKKLQFQFIQFKSSSKKTLKEERKNFVHELVVRLKDPKNSFPIATMINVNKTVPHFITLVYNPFSDAVLVLDPLIFYMEYNPVFKIKTDDKNRYSLVTTSSYRWSTWWSYYAVLPID